MNLAEFLNRLDDVGEPIPADRLQELLDKLEFREADFGPALRFHADRYQRNRLRKTDHYEALLLCFEAGQRTPIHDHSGSACGVKVCLGTGTETLFESTPEGWLYATQSQALPTGGVVASVDRDIHQLSNLQPDRQRLATLHIYSPPLGEVGNYSISDNSKILVEAAVCETGWSGQPAADPVEPMTSA